MAWLDHRRLRTGLITFSHGGISFSGSLYLPDKALPCPAVVAVHPASAGEQNHPFYDHLKLELPRRGIAVLAFDRRGSGGSGGDFETASFEDLAGDVLAAVRYLRSRPEIDPARIGLHGTSQGAWIAPLAAVQDPEIAFLVAVSASGVSPAVQMDYGVAFHLQHAGFAPDVIAQVLRLRSQVNEYFRGHLTHEQVVSELARYEHESWFEMAYLYSSAELPRDVSGSKWHFEMDYEPISPWRALKLPALFLFAEVDEWVPMEQSKLTYAGATRHMGDASLVTVKGVDHLMRCLEGSQKGLISRAYLNILLDWLHSR